MTNDIPNPEHPTPNPQRAGTALAFDFGEKRIGVAVADLGVGIAHPLQTVHAEDNKTRFAAIAALLAEWKPVQLIVGEPHHADGSAHEIARLARRFAQRLEGRFLLAQDSICASDEKGRCPAIFFDEERQECARFGETA